MGGQNTANYQELGGSKWVVAGELEVSGTLTLAAGAVISVSGSDKMAILQAAVATPVAGVVAGYKIARGVATVTGSLAIATGLAAVIDGVACLAATPSVTDGMWVSVTNSATAGNIDVYVTKPTAANNVEPAASTAGVQINWIAVGT
jgi:hypothetical protein